MDPLVWLLFSKMVFDIIILWFIWREVRAIRRAVYGKRKGL